MLRKLALGTLSTILLAACGGAAPAAKTSDGAVKAPESVIIAYQPGIGYAPLLLMKEKHWIEQDFPSTKVEFRLLSNGDAIRDGIISGQIQIGSGGVGPFLVGWAKGVDYQLIASMDMMDLWLNVKDPAIQSLKDFKPNMKIASPAIDSIQAIALRKLAQDQLGDAHKLDQNMVAMSHPDGVQNLLSGAIVGHFTAPPFQFQEVDKASHTVAKSYDAFGPTTFNSVFSTRKFYDAYPQFVEKFYSYLRRADDLIKSDPVGAAKLVASADGKPDLADTYKDWMTRPNVTYMTKPAGFLKYATFMKEINFIPRVPGSIKEIELPFLQKEGGT